VAPGEKYKPITFEEDLMAISMCHNCAINGGVISAKTFFSAFPIGYPDTSVLCSGSKCISPGMILLENKEPSEYQAGSRIFKLAGGKVKVRVI
jgi:hypothetical protein